MEIMQLRDNLKVVEREREEKKYILKNHLHISHLNQTTIDTAHAVSLKPSS